jgi:hypothetical protein
MEKLQFSGHQHGFRVPRHGTWRQLFSKRQKEKRFQFKRQYKTTGGSHISYQFKHHKKYKNTSCYGNTFKELGCRKMLKISFDGDGQTMGNIYTSKSAYQILFQGSFSKLKLSTIWKAGAEPKCRFFAWTLLHKKILTANNLIKRNWANDPICKLCGVEPETPNHLCKDYPFSKQVWTSLKQWLHLSALDSVAMTGSLHGFWQKCRAKFER